MHEHCITCRFHRGELEAPGGVIYRDAFWQLEHMSMPVPLLGWLVLKPLRHVESFADLTADELAPYGLLAGRITDALRRTLDPAKVYMCLYAEAVNAAHVHIHFIPRFEDTPPEHRGPGVFQLLARATAGGPSAAEQGDVERLVDSLRQLLSD